MPKVSVVLPVYNGAAYLGACLDSLLAQSFGDFEILLIDDGSSDGSREIAQGYLRDSRVRYLENPANLGTASSTNLGHRLARGDYIAHADQDDLSEPQRLALQVAFLDSHAEVCIVSGQMRAFGAASGTIGAPEQDADIKSNFLPASHNLFNPTAMIRKAFADEHGLFFNPNQKGAADYGYFVEAMCRGGVFANLPQVLLNYRAHAEQQSGDPSQTQAITSDIRRRVLGEFFPALSQREARQIEPLLRWTSPPPLPLAEVETGLALLPRLLASDTSCHGESRAQRDGFLHACQRRWNAAVQHLRTGPA